MKIIHSKPQQIIRSVVNKYVEFIAPTYGPTGKKILIVQNEFNHEAVDDGKRASQAFELEDEFENSIAQYIKETTQKGKDGTTTAGLIMGNIVLEALKDIDDQLVTVDTHGMAVGLRKGLDEAVKKIKQASKKIKTKEELYAIAHNSYNNEEIATLIADTVHKIGSDGVLAIEDSKGTETTVEVVNGLELQKGYVSPYFINADTQDRVILTTPGILIVNKKLNLFGEVAPLMKRAIDAGVRDIVIIADGFGEDVVGNCIMAKLRGAFRPLLVEAPGFGDKTEILHDIAIVTGAQVVDENIVTLDKVSTDYLGSCETITAYKDKTVILGGKGKTKDYIEKLKTQLKSATPHDADKLSKRIAALQGGIAVIKVGAYTENEQKGIKTKVENAVNAAQIAFKDGVVPGAGKTFADIKTSSDLLNEALKAPRKQLEENGKKYLDEYTVDPTGVLITALETSVSIATGLITMGGISVPKRKKEERGL